MLFVLVRCIYVIMLSLCKIYNYINYPPINVEKKSCAALGSLL